MCFRPQFANEALDLAAKTLVCMDFLEFSTKAVDKYVDESLKTQPKPRRYNLMLTLVIF